MSEFKLCFLALLLLSAPTPAQYSTEYSFSPSPMIYFMPQLYSVMIVDVNHDGRNDMFVLPYGHKPDLRLFVCYQTETGEVNNCVAYDTLLNGTDLDTIDVNWDGQMDVVVTDAWGKGIRFFVYKEDSGVVEYLRIPDSWGAAAITVGDFNNDSLPDVAGIQFYNGAPDSFKVYYQGPKSVFDSVRWYPMQKHAYAGAWTSTYAADLNGDGLTDLAISGGPPDQVLSTYLQQPDGSLALGQHIPFNFPVRMYWPEDVNDDGRTDLMMAIGRNVPDARIAIFYQSGSGTFSNEPELLEDFHTPFVVKTADMDGDGRRDLVVAHDDRTWMTIFPKKEGGVYGPYKLLEFTGDVGQRNKMSLGDLNGDGLADVAFVEWTGSMGYFINTTPRSPTR